MSKLFPTLANSPAASSAPKRPAYVPKLTTLRELDLETELLEQYNRALQLLSDAEGEEGVTLAQKATTLNGITSILTQITRNQSELFSVERVKALETTLISVLKGFPDINQAFLEAYEKALTDAS